MNNIQNPEQWRIDRMPIIATPVFFKTNQSTRFSMDRVAGAGYFKAFFLIFNARA
jgi:hypothetical protein